jgi:crotonobetainyl-CoA:carnitine CoA-transferase CaiB-like acyl-CoA transferase
MAPTWLLRVLSRCCRLRGVTVLAVEQAVAAPFCTSRLADAGATVIKVERPGGDFARGYDAAAGGKAATSSGSSEEKNLLRSIWPRSGGMRTLEKLVAGADVLVQNLKPGVMDRLGFSSERLKADYPSLIYCTISGDGAMGRIPVERHTTFSCGPKAGWRPLRAVPKHLLASGCRSLTSQPARQPMRQFSKPS